MPKLAALSSGPFSPGEKSRERFLSRLFQTCFALQASLDRRFLKFGVTFQEASVLLRCVKTTGISPGKLAVVLARDKGKITRFIDRLVARGFVVRYLNARDRRSTLIKPTREGRLAARRLAVLLDNVRKELFAGISDGDLRRAEKTLPELHKNALILGGKGQSAGDGQKRKVKSRERLDEAELLAARVHGPSAKRAAAENTGSAAKRRAQRLSRSQINALFPR